MNNKLELPCIIISKEHKERKLLLDKHRGSYVFTDDNRVLGILTSKEVDTYYDVLDNPRLLNIMLKGYLERMINYFDIEETQGVQNDLL